MLFFLFNGQYDLQIRFLWIKQLFYYLFWVYKIDETICFKITDCHYSLKDAISQAKNLFPKHIKYLSVYTGHEIISVSKSHFVYSVSKFENYYSKTKYRLAFKPFSNKIPQDSIPYNDIVVVRVRKAFSFIDKSRTYKINFPNPIEFLPVGSFGTVSGWGLTGNTKELIYDKYGYYPQQLRAVHVPILKLQCIVRFKGLIKGGQFCFGFKEGKKDSCFVDSGGVFIIDNVQVGTISFCIECALAGY